MCHSRESGNPSEDWIPDQVRNDKKPFAESGGPMPVFLTQHEMKVKGRPLRFASFKFQVLSFKQEKESLRAERREARQSSLLIFILRSARNQ
jgi:hypothetical protein